MLLGRQRAMHSAARWSAAKRSLATAVHSREFPISPLEPQSMVSYDALQQRLSLVQQRLNKPLTLAEKILYAHLDDPGQDLQRAKSQLRLRPKRVALHDANAQMALLQFISAGLERVKVPTSVHTDHLITAKSGGEQDLADALAINAEVYDFLESACAKYGIAYWKPGAGILHQTIFEQYAYPGGLMIGTDSHTPNAAGLGMLAIGVGGMEAVEVMAGSLYEVTHPKIIGVKLKGKMSGWTSAKDIILKLASTLTVQGGTGSIIEYYGDGVHTLSCTGMGTIGNMGAEVGATSSIFPYTDSIGQYLRATRRDGTAEAAKQAQHYLKKDDGAEYDRHVEIDLTELEPHINGPFTPDLSFPLSEFGKAARASPWPQQISAALIGSCTNSSYEDFGRAASLVKQAKSANLHLKTKLLVAPGSEMIRSTLERDGILDTFSEADGTLLANACGACVGQWERPDMRKGDANSIVSSFNRNFVGRQDGNPATHSFVASPEVVTAMAYGGSLSFNPMTDSIPLDDGGEFRFSPPLGDTLPAKGYEDKLDFYQPPLEDSQDLGVKISAESQRIQLISPFNSWSGEPVQDLELLIKVKGKCTTDHISAAGPWYKYRGHLQNISENLLIGAINAGNDRPNRVMNRLTNEWGSVPEVAKSYRNSGKRWAVVAGENYGEGSSREVAAMSPRFMGCFAVISKGIARIHEMNLKKQGILPLLFKNKDDYEVIDPADKLQLRDLDKLCPGSSLTLLLSKADGSTMNIQLRHSMNQREIAWFKAGSALNFLREAASADANRTTV